VCGDIQAILTVIGRHETLSTEVSSPLDLHEANLSGAQLFQAHLAYADLINSHLEDAHLIGADLRMADFGGAHLDGADLREADLSYTDLSEVKGLTQSQLIVTKGNRYTKLPSELEPFRPASWSK
jgi:uncharacterized protein YjbI with pentapeptide repeats